MLSLTSASRCLTAQSAMPLPLSLSLQNDMTFYPPTNWEGVGGRGRGMFVCSECGLLFMYTLLSAALLCYLTPPYIHFKENDHLFYCYIILLPVCILINCLFGFSMCNTVYLFTTLIIQDKKKKQWITSLHCNSSVAVVTCSGLVCIIQYYSASGSMGEMFCTVIVVILLIQCSL